MIKIIKKYGFRGIATVSLALISAIIITYHPQDPSLFFVSTRTGAVHNIGGWLGAYIAAYIFFLIGSCAYGVIAGIWHLWYLRMVKRERNIVDQVVACVVGVIIFPILASLHQWRLTQHGFVPGGYMGEMGTKILHYFFDDIIIFIGVYVVCVAVLVTIVNVSTIEIFLTYVQKTMRLVARLNVHVHCRIMGAKIRHMLTSSLAYVRRGVWTSSLQDKDILAIDYQEFLQQHAQSGVDSNYIEQSVSQTQMQDEISVPIPSTDVSTPIYDLPLKQLLHASKPASSDYVSKEEQELAQRLEEKLARFGIIGSVVSIKTGPVVTLFEYQPHIDAKLSKILALEDDLALALQALSIRIIAPIPGTPVVGFEVARKVRDTVSFVQLVQATSFAQRSELLPLMLGVDTVGNPVIADLASMPHLLVAGATGSGKSIALNVFLVSLLYRCAPEHLKLILIDPKRLEFAPYADIPHLLFPIVTQAKDAVLILQWLVTTMEERYEQMALCGVRNITDFNKVCAEHEMQELPFIVVMIDELADLMMVAGKEIEDNIARLAQMARASGIHLMVATQRPSVDVITGIIKANFSSRISFRVATKIDARTVMDQAGAEKLLGKGDMLYVDSSSALRRIHGAFISHQEVERIAQHLRSLQKPTYLSLKEIETHDNAIDEQDQALFNEVLLFIAHIDEVSISLLQRKFKIGYNRAARIMETLEAQGKILSIPGSKMRKVLS